MQLAGHASLGQFTWLHAATWKTKGHVWHIVKTHDLPRDAAEALLAADARMICAIRDPRDAVTSLMRYQNYPFEQAGQTIAKSAGFVERLVARAAPGDELIAAADRLPDRRL